jgi:CMP/dCMP kinase
MLITISGLPGSGKTVVGRILAQQLGYKFYSVGDFRGEMAQKLGFTIDELNKVGEKEFWTDKKADDWQKNIGQTQDNVVVDGWLAFHFIPNSFKIFIEVDPQAAAHRIFIDQRPDEKYLNSEEAVAKQVADRLAETRNRFLKYYQVDFLNKDYYDLIIDSSKISPQEVVNKIIKHYERTKNNRS